MPKDQKPPPAEPQMPKALAAALKKNEMARARFENLSPSERREFIEWINEAKLEETSAKRESTRRRDREGPQK